jgi:hypothetical protein
VGVRRPVGGCVRPQGGPNLSVLKYGICRICGTLNFCSDYPFERSLERVLDVDHDNKAGAYMVMEIKCDDEVRVNIDFPPALRRKLARQSVERDIDLQSLIRQILESEPAREENGF